MEGFHLSFGQALCNQTNQSPPRLVHIFYQVGILNQPGQVTAKELKVHPSTVTRGYQSALKILGDQSENESQWVSAYLNWLIDSLAHQIEFHNDEDLRYLITLDMAHNEQLRGQVMWSIYDWVIKNWCLMQFNAPHRIKLNDGWLMIIDCAYDQDKVTITRIWRP